MVRFPLLSEVITPHLHYDMIEATLMGLCFLAELIGVGVAARLVLPVRDGRALATAVAMWIANMVQPGPDGPGFTTVDLVSTFLFPFAAAFVAIVIGGRLSGVADPVGAKQTHAPPKANRSDSHPVSRLSWFRWLGLAGAATAASSWVMLLVGIPVLGWLPWILRARGSCGGSVPLFFLVGIAHGPVAAGIAEQRPNPRVARLGRDRVERTESRDLDDPLSSQERDAVLRCSRDHSAPDPRPSPTSLFWPTVVVWLALVPAGIARAVAAVRSNTPPIPPKALSVAAFVIPIPAFMVTVLWLNLLQATRLSYLGMLDVSGFFVTVFLGFLVATSWTENRRLGRASVGLRPVPGPLTRS